MVLIDYSKGTFQNTGKGKHGKFSQTVTFYICNYNVLAHQWQIVMDKLLKNISEPNGMTN